MESRKSTKIHRRQKRQIIRNIGIFILFVSILLISKPIINNIKGEINNYDYVKLQMYQTSISQNDDNLSVTFNK